MMAEFRIGDLSCCAKNSSRARGGTLDILSDSRCALLTVKQNLACLIYHSIFLILNISPAAREVLLCYSLACKLLRRIYHYDSLGHKAQKDDKGLLFHSSLSNRSQVGHQISPIILTCAFPLYILRMAQK
jgi:hypothetical protein